jgi:amidase
VGERPRQLQAAGMSPLGFGTDSGGSLRLPAHFCGVAAFLPTAGVLPVSGVIDDEGPIAAISDPRTRVGVIARRVCDLRTILRPLLPVEASDEATAPYAILDRDDGSINGIRVGLVAGNGIVDPDQDTVRVVRAAATVLEDASATVEEVSPPQGAWEITREVWRSYGGHMRSLDLYRVLR